jgi:hypothetical protein
VDYAIADRDCSTDHRVWFRYLLVRIRNVAPAQHQAGQRRIGQSDRIIDQAAKNKPVELLGRGADGRHRLAVSLGKSSRMTWPMTARLISDPEPDRRRAASD